MQFLFTTLLEQAYSDQSEATDIQSQEFSSQLQIQQNSLSYSSQKSMEKNRYLIITTSQEIAEKIDKDQQSITLNSINSINSVNKQIYYVLNQQRRMKYQRSLLISKQKGRQIEL
ncbi:unnamed protein product (macronuclear) [Paramecium tetraurelia]|uniref:Uncharacterized protein n=1 Tax=Paramecium tetraurelia TaxID=5888 RepID=A0DSF9_PARTE|nr:uncharacterized protein GSPATT00019680001 [Paramecium tetraurelia]CAK85976.1 unnamed protein product [Paramecium tetraurelia]|eukprot:XP_001453373.1 hypothetical protein (macronuclear) [Paramecium tetraurelia strain d4-2]